MTRRFQTYCHHSIFLRHRNNVIHHDDTTKHPFRHVVTHSQSRTSTTSVHGRNNLLPITEKDGTTLAYEAFSLLARQGRTWRRLGHLVDMAMDSPFVQSKQIRTMADVGADHGLLTMGLAVTGRFDKVLGIDASEQALRDGALTLQQTIQQYVTEKLPSADVRKRLIVSRNLLPAVVEFRVGNGLSVAHQGEADAVCMAGMGVHTMISIFEHGLEEGITDVDRVGCQQIFVQPTNSRPRNLIFLYDKLQSAGWTVLDERIEQLSSRWYISSSFVRTNLLLLRGDGHQTSLALNHLPGSKLWGLKETDAMRPLFDSYKRHHIAWIRQDYQASGNLSEEDKRWLDAFG